MSPRPFIRSTVWLSLFLACQGSKAQTAPAQPVKARTAPPPSTPKLDEAGPKMDLVAGRQLFHLYGPNLVLPIASPGLYKYVQEYNSPWMGLSTVQGKRARRLGSKAATLRFGWLGRGPATLFVRVHGDSAGRKLTLRANGRVLKNTKLDPGWNVVRASVPEKVLLQGENQLSIATGKKGAYFHSLELAEGPLDAPPDWPGLTAGGRDPSALGAWPRVTRLLEIPKDGWFVTTTLTGGKKRHFRASVTPEEGATKVLFDEEQAPNTKREHTLSLAAYAGQLVTLELAVAGGMAGEDAWLSPRILLPKVAPLPRPAPLKNAIIVVADALRADKLPMYAKTKVRTPNITQAARDSGVTFLSTQAASPSSPPSHAAIQSGCMPRQNGILGDTSKPTPNTPMISAILGKAGFGTAFVGDNGFAMNRLKPLCKWTSFHRPNAEGKGGDCQAIVKGILDFADEQTKAGKRFFVSSVAFEAHTAYLYHPGTTEHYFSGPFDDAIGKKPDGVILSAIVGGKLRMTPARWAQLKGLYDGEVEHLDGCFGALRKGLSERKVDKDTALVLLADHGEGFLEHKGMGHAFGHWAELTNVPLIFFLPGLAKGTTLDTVVSHVDVVPTLLDLMGLPPDPRVQGESLLPMLSRQGAWVPRVMPSEYGRSYSLRSKNLHYLVEYSGKESLYDIALDPTEKVDVLESRPISLRYFRELAGLYLATRRQWKTPVNGTINNPKLVVD